MCTLREYLETNIIVLTYLHNKGVSKHNINITNTIEIWGEDLIECVSGNIRLSVFSHQTILSSWHCAWQSGSVYNSAGNSAIVANLHLIIGWLCDL